METDGIIIHRVQKGEWETYDIPKGTPGGTPTTSNLLFEQKITFNFKPTARKPTKYHIKSVPMPTNKHPNFKWLAIFIEDKELQSLFGNFKSFRQWASSHGYRQCDITQLKEHRKEQLQK